MTQQGSTHSLDELAPTQDSFTSQRHLALGGYTTVYTVLRCFVTGTGRHFAPLLTTGMCVDGSETSGDLSVSLRSVDRAHVILAKIGSQHRS